MSGQQLRDQIVRWGRSLFERGLTAGSSGNISARTSSGFIATPTNSCLGFLDAGQLSVLDDDGRHVSGGAPTKELPLHFAFYKNRPETRAVVHLHSTYATALSCLSDVDPADAVPPITPYVVMRVGKVPVVAYTRALDHAAVLLQNHGPVVSGPSLDSAVFAIEELEEAAKLAIITRGMKTRLLDAGQIADLDRHFRLK
jgi:3-dehydro-4-phosphotetronate decarboxylase